MSLHKEHSTIWSLATKINNNVLSIKDEEKFKYKYYDNNSLFDVLHDESWQFRENILY